MQNTDSELRQILSEATRIAVVGIKADPDEDAFQVPRYLQLCGYELLPVNPKLDSVLGECCVTCLSETASPVEIVNLFRAPDHIPGHVDEILSLPSPPDAVWMQLGIRHEPSAERLRAAGIRVVEDLCIMVEHRRLLRG